MVLGVFGCAVIAFTLCPGLASNNNVNKRKLYIICIMQTANRYYTTKYIANTLQRATPTPLFL
jgi:hypothetical protein